MQKSRNILDLLIRERRERRHAPLQSPVSYHRSDRVTLVVVQHQLRSHQVRTCLAMCIVAVAKPTCRHEDLPAALDCVFVELWSTQQVGKGVRGAFLLWRTPLFSSLRLLLLCVHRLIRLHETNDGRQQQPSAQDNESMWHPVPPLTRPPPQLPVFAVRTAP